MSEANVTDAPTVEARLEALEAVASAREARLEALEARADPKWSPASWVLRPFSTDRRCVQLQVSLRELVSGEVGRDGIDAYLDPKRGPTFVPGSAKELKLDQLVEAVRKRGKLTDSVYQGSVIQAVVVDMETCCLRLLLWHAKYQVVPDDQRAPIVKRRV